MKAWHVVYTHMREEPLAQEHLLRQSFETYWPRYQRRVTHARKTRDVATSLFPRYLFARFDADETGWRAISSTRGVVSVIRHGLTPVAVSDRLIDEIRGREDASGFVVLGQQLHLQKGQRIELRGKAFKGHELIFEARKDEQRVVALLNLLGREFKVEVPLASVGLAGHG